MCLKDMQARELHMVAKKEKGMKKTEANQTRASNLQTYSRSFSS